MSGVKWLQRVADHLRLVPNLRINGTVTPVPQHAFRPWTGIALHLRFLLFRITCILIYIWPGISGILPVSFHPFFFTSWFEQSGLYNSIGFRLSTLLLLSRALCREFSADGETPPALHQTELKRQRRLVDQRQTAGLPCPDDNGKSVAVTSDILSLSFLKTNAQEIASV